MIHKTILIFVTFILLTLPACGGMNHKAPPPIATTIPSPSGQDLSPRDENLIKDPTLHAGLWQETSGQDLFKDLRAYRIGDLVTVNIVETSKASKKADTKTSRESSINAGIDSALGWESKIKNLTSLGNDKVRNAYGNNPMFKGSLSNSFTGSGATSRDESMTASITARVVDVQPNGNLFIQGTREVRVNNETQYIMLSGFIRPEDISPDNTVLSSYIGDAKITYRGSGPVSDKQRPGWLTRAVDFVWPF